ncbi:glycosyl hydrolase family 92-domain-containing protein [Mycena rosella]|uniref:Glycosyl hydrolase family 92-domain-containing protein n=1 Tax=Mycena rosella TaxID=1033263 RepID=A0AAD7GR82_MYCRO|nr:glycosyl hydrolase family 92-domain-containing protein [Mycena rosella]
MFNPTTAIAAVILGICSSGVLASDDYTQHVHPFVGTEGAIPGSSLGGGNMFPGVALPFGAVKIGIDTSVVDLPQGGISSANSGYTPRGNSTGFSLIHISGTGGQPKYGVVSQMPLVGSIQAQGINVANNMTYLTNRTNESASVGYFRTTFDTGVTTELTASRHAGILRYHFPAAASTIKSSSNITIEADTSSVTGTSSASNTTAGTQAHVLVDLAHALPSGGGGFIAQKYVKGELHVASDYSGYSGSAYYDLGWNQGQAWQIFFCGNFSVPASVAWTFFTPYNFLVPPATAPTLSPYYDIYASDSLAIGALFTWEHNSALQLESRVGVSFLSEEKACQFVRTEVPWKQTFNETMQAVKDAWNTEILSSITVPKENGAINNTLLGLLYTHLYGSALMPTDRTGENPGWQSAEPYYDDWYTIWDIFRCTTTFYHMVFTDRYVGMLRSLIDTWRHDGYMPDGRSGNENGRTQGGSDSDNVFADAYARGLGKVSTINWHDAYSAMLTNAEQVPKRNMDFNAWDGGTKEGRNALPDWKQYGYITTNYSRSISKGVEYAQNDFGLYVVAKGLGEKSDAKKYLKRSENWKNFWNSDATADLTTAGLGVYTGFFGSRAANGSFDQSVNVTNCGGCTWGDLTYEALIWEYSFTVPHDIEALIQKMGGTVAFEARLDASFVNGLSAGSGASNTAGTCVIPPIGSCSSDPKGRALFNPGNEPSFATPFLYNYIPGKQYKSVEKTRYIVNTYYTLQNDGIPGNQDAGAMATWLLWNLIGLYPISSQPIFLVTAPFFKALDIRLGTTNPTSPASKSNMYLKIRAPKLSQQNIYVQGLNVNGKKISRSYLLHDEIANGATVIFDMGPQPSAWDLEVPPSFLSGDFTV